MAKSKSRSRTGLPRQVFKSRVMDFLLGFVGLSMAAASAYLPIYVYINTDEFGPPTLAYVGRDSLEAELAHVRQEPLFKDLGNEIDTTVTGSVRPTSDTGETKEKEPAKKKKENPLVVIGPPALDLPSETTGFELVFASRGRALIRDGKDIIPVAIGSRLPDGSSVESIMKADGKWRLITTKNVRLTMKQE